MHDYEKLGVFYLGRTFDPESGRAGDAPFLLDSKDLVTHAVCVGMTGSGKTGLCIGLLEEAAIDGIPAIVIDPKGDLSNLLLTFPQLRPEDFLPFVNEDEARNRGLSPEAFAAAEAERWRTGLAQHDQTPERIARLRDAAEFTVYTPASSAGAQVSILRSFDAPGAALLEDREAMRERVAGASSSLLSLAGLADASAQSREHILLSTILDRKWREGAGLTLAEIVQQIQNPPVTRLGVMDLESFYPAKERFELAMQLNAVLASPGFEAWLEGEPLDVGRMLWNGAGKPRVSIFSIAHLNDTERMFFVSLLLNSVLSWMRPQPGTTSLRALLYMDEIAGYLPPVANPASKAPFMTMLKQGRAFGLGVVLATQNPVDLDYKALSNAGTWFIGRLQTERDKARLLDGLSSATGQSGAAFDRASVDALLSRLGARTFLINNVHEDRPVLFQTRWTLSYLRGPLTRAQLRAVTGRTDSSAATARAAAAPPHRAETAVKPVLPPGVPELFAPVAAPRTALSPLLYAAAQVRFSDARAGVDELREIAVAVPFPVGAAPLDWDDARPVPWQPGDLATEPPAEALYEELPVAAANPKNYGAWKRDFANWLYATQQLDRWRAGKLASDPGESERDFRIRAQQAAREERDRVATELRSKYAPRFAALEDRMLRAHHAVERERAQVNEQRMGTAMSVGATLLGAFLGRKTFSATSVGRASGAMRSYGRIDKEKADVARAEESLAAVEQALEDLNARFETEVAAAQERVHATMSEVDAVPVRAKKANISVSAVALVWLPDQLGAK